ncbi:hypothetical protein F2P56_028114 [Juglans regia]|uniref:CCHC-type domain-containing protein n=1 Tax=Juglans regia TaxID=51240 RepID=A0A833UJ89_JUGRE|nr:hypothetical protein F2P56_028114 [Juglans regia]
MEPSVNFTNTGNRGRNSFRGGRNGRNGRGGRNTTSNRGGRFSYNQAPAPSQTSYNQRPTCQVCNKTGHVALQCRHQFDHSYQYAAPPSFSANYTTPQAQVFSDNTWYPDSAATHHITHDFDNLNLSSEPYSGNDQIRVGDGSGISIQNTGHNDGEVPPHRSNP